MEKTTFSLTGADSSGDEDLIERALRRLPGILSVKISSLHKTGTIIYDEQSVDENTIHIAITKAGGYQVQKIILNNSSTHMQNGSDSMFSGMQPKAVLITGFLAAFSALSLIANVILGMVVIKTINTGGTKNVAANYPAPSPSAAPAEAPLGPQEFTITKDDHFRGNSKAKVTLVEFSDFECPFCERHFPTIKRILSEYGNNVRLVYKHFPLSNIHPSAQKAAEASECANEQGKFWEMHDKLFANNTALTVPDLKNYAGSLGLNTAKFNDCLDSGRMAPAVNKDYQEGVQKGVNGTPATFVNGQLLSGAQPFESFKALIDQELKK